jgi:Ca-activated chloride channel family protein
MLERSRPMNRPARLAAVALAALTLLAAATLPIGCGPRGVGGPDALQMSGRPAPPPAPTAPEAKRQPMAMRYLAEEVELEPQPTVHNTEAYDHIRDNPFVLVATDPLSTFSIDVDTASYANVRRFLTQGQLPPPDAVRIEELINYFTYEYPAPSTDRPFSVNVEVAAAPWALKHRLVRVGLKGREIAFEDRRPSNLVFLLDVSGSMNSPLKLPLLKTAMKLLVEQLGENDTVSVAVYAGASGLVLPPTTCDKKETIVAALEQLQAGGSTNAGSGIQLAYETATANFIKGGVNRVILCTDGDFNVGITNRGDLVRLIEDKARSGVFLTVLGFGMGNYKDATLQDLADKGNGNHAYIDSEREARKVLVEQVGGTLVTIAKDVKIQVEFNPALVRAFRLIGYENRILRHQDFADDTKDAGEIGAGHTVTALYELVPVGQDIPVPGIDPLKYQKPPELTEAARAGELLTVKLRYKQPDGDTSTQIDVPVKDPGKGYDDASPDFKFAAAVAAFGMILRDSPFKAGANLDAVLELAADGVASDPGGYRAEFLALARKAKSLKK